MSSRKTDRDRPSLLTSSSEQEISQATGIDNLSGPAVSPFELKIVTPVEMGVSPERWENVLQRAQELVDAKRLPAVSLQVQRCGLTTGVHHFGTSSVSTPRAVHDDTLFIIASLTKPIISMATMLLVERGELALNTSVSHFFPELKIAGKRSLTVKHLLTHTSGLPDMLPNNVELRSERSPLSRFVEETLKVDFQFPPGRSAQYQSMGFALLGAILQQLTQRSARDFLQQELFAPLGMQQTWLGLSSSEAAGREIAEMDMSSTQQPATAWDWNSSYWRELGAPWGGLISTAADVSRFLRAMLLPGDQLGTGLFSDATLEESVGNRLFDYPSIPDAEKRNRGWGLGWKLNWKDHRHAYADILPGSVAGHWGATGTLFWLDRSREIGVVLLGTKPLDDTVSPLTSLSNMIASSFTDPF